MIEEKRSKKDIDPDFSFSLKLLLSRIKVVEDVFYEDKVQEAYEICKRFDEKDTPFVALSLKIKALLWTNDRGILENQGEYKP